MVSASHSCWLLEPHLDIGTLDQMDAIDKPYLAALARHDDGRRPGAFAEKANTFHQSPICYASRGKDDVVAGG